MLTKMRFLVYALLIKHIPLETADMKRLVGSTTLYTCLALIALPRHLRHPDI